MSSMKALKIISQGQAAVEEVPVPKLRPDYLLVKTSYVALNPTDWKHIDKIPTPGATVGCDYSGTVVDVGPQVKKSFKKGDRVAGFVHGGNAVEKEDGAFGDYLVAKGDVQMKVPDSVSDEDAATLGVGIATVAQGLYQRVGLPWPNAPAKEKFPVLIYGGSTATGAMAIQFAKLSNLEPIVTCSPRNFQYCQSLGATHCFDYNSPSCGADIRAHTNDSLFYAFDCISEGPSPQICCDALSTTTAPASHPHPPRDGGKPLYSALLPVSDFPRDDVTHAYTLAYSAIGEYFTMGPGGREFAASEEDKEYQERFWEVATALVAEGKIAPHEKDTRQGGLQGILEGLDDLRNGRVSGKKVVYRVGQ
ncbi:MAG: hypothetical protein M1822_000496 [Bathelium mastoideum]|nr:MAG: hypothetical protein M1822_000496 [Bathelium mastoideum]